MPSRGLAEVALGRRNLQPLLASAAQPATASPLSENLRRYEKYGLGVEPRLCLALEDFHNGVRSASSAGMMTVMVPDLLEPTDEIRGLCTFVARDLHEVRRLILAVGSVC